MHKIEQFLFKPVDNSFLVVFRVAFGFLITAEAWGAIMTGWVRRAFMDPVMTFPFIDVSWLKPLPGDGMYYYFFVMGCFGVMVMLGYRYRIGIIGYGLMWTAVYLMQKTNYNNHYYLLVLLCIIMSFMPANRAFSLDSKHRPDLHSLTCPNWCRICSNRHCVYLCRDRQTQYGLATRRIHAHPHLVQGGVLACWGTTPGAVCPLLYCLGRRHF